MLPKFLLTAVVKRETLDNVSLSVEASSLEEALAVAKEALEEFPEPVTVDGVKNCYIDNRITLGTEVISIEEDKYVA